MSEALETKTVDVSGRLTDLRNSQTLWLILLAAAHVPFLMLYYLQLWNQEHYRFFPFALGVFVVTFRQRIVGAVTRPIGWTGKTLIAMDVLLLIGGTLLNSQWLVAVGA